MAFPAFGGEVITEQGRAGWDKAASTASDSQNASFCRERTKRGYSGWAEVVWNCSSSSTRCGAHENNHSVKLPLQFRN